MTTDAFATILLAAVVLAGLVGFTVLYMSIPPEGTRTLDYTRDGHRLRLVLDPGSNVQPSIQCPGNCHLWRERDDEMTDGEADALERAKAEQPCWLAFTVSEVGSEWLEWNTGESPIVISGDLEIEWVYTGDDEMMWRPVYAEEA